MTAPPVDRLRVEKCDREAAASNIVARLKMQHGGEQPWMDASTESMRMGEQDHHWEVQAFAKHRHQALLEQAARVGSLIEALSTVCEHFDGKRRDKDWFETERLVRAALQETE